MYRVAKCATEKKLAILSKEFKSKKYQGVYYRELDGRHRSYFLCFRLNGVVKRFPIGKKSEGITEVFCTKEKARILNEVRFGGTAAALQKVKKEAPTFSDLMTLYIDKNDLKDTTRWGYER